MASVIAMQMQADPDLRPGPVGVLAYLAGTLLLAGGVFQASPGYDSSGTVLGMSGGLLEGLGIVGVVAGLAVLAIGTVARYQPKPGALRGIVVLFLGFLSFFTSFGGFLLVGCFLTMVLGGLILQGPATSRRT